MTTPYLDFIFTSEKEHAALLPLFNYFELLGPGVRMVKIHKRNFSRGYIRRLAPHVVASYDGAIDRIRQAGWAGKTIYVDHGLSPVKYYAYRYSTLHDVDLLFYPGPIFKEIMTTLDPGFQNGLLGGLPKVDGLINDQIDRAAYCAELQLDPAQPVVLFAPTWGGKYSTDWGIANARYLAGYPNLVMAPHPADYRLAKKYGAVLPRESGNINNLIKLADIVVSDVSSVVGEAALLDKPIIQLILPNYPGCFPNPEKRQSGIWLSQAQLDHFTAAADPLKRPFKLAYLDRDWVLGQTAKPEHLQQTIGEVIAAPQRFKRQRDDWNKLNYWQPDGHTNQRLARMIMEFIETGQLKQLG